MCSNFYANGQYSLLTEPTYLHASHSYTLRVADPHLSDLTPWQPAGNADDATNRGVISPMPTDENPSPTQSLGTSQHSGQSYVQPHEISTTPSSMFNVFYCSSFSGPFFDESRAPPNLGATTGDHPDVGIQGQNTPPRNSALDHHSLSSGDQLTNPCNDADRPEHYTPGRQWSPKASAVSYVW